MEQAKELIEELKKKIRKKGNRNSFIFLIFYLSMKHKKYKLQQMLRK